MLICPFNPNCKEKFVNIVFLNAHLKLSHSKEWVIPYKCGQPGCFASYDRPTFWRRHMEKAHFDLFESLPVIREASEEDVVEEELSFRDFEPAENSSNIRSLEELRENIDVSAIQFVASLRSSSSVTIGTCELAVNACNDVVESVVNYLKYRTADIVKRRASNLDFTEIEQLFDELLRPLDHLSTEKKQNAYFYKQPGFVNPQQKVFGAPRFEPRQLAGGNIVQKAVYDEWQFVSIKETLKAVLSVPELLDELMAAKPSTNAVLKEFSDGQLCKEHPLLEDPAKIFAALQLYYDDAEILLDFECEVRSMGFQPAGFEKNWQNAIKLILREVGMSRINPAQQAFLEKFDCVDIGDARCLSEEKQFLLALLLLPSVIKPTPHGSTKVQKLDRLTHLNAVEYFIHFAKSGCVIRETVQNIKKNTQLTQPFLLICTEDGSLNTDVSQRFLIVDYRPIEIPQKSIAHCIQYLLASYYCFNVNFPVGLTQIFCFLEILSGIKSLSAAGKTRELAIKALND